ncbi:Prolyl 4-hydroxylase, partial [Lachnellula suecica]
MILELQTNFSSAWLTSLSPKMGYLGTALLFTSLTTLLAAIWSTHNYTTALQDHHLQFSQFLHRLFDSHQSCNPNHAYTTTIISTSPLLIHITNFLTAAEAAAIILTGTPNLKPSFIANSDSNTRHPSDARSSLSGALPPNTPPVSCVLARAREFLGPSLLAEYEDFGIPQLVRYSEGEKFDLHYDWFASPQPIEGRRGVFVNRVASFFVYLDTPGRSAGGETWFPHIDIDIDVEESDGKGKGEMEGRWRRHEQGGVAFRPQRGSAVFWVNLWGNETGDWRVQHAGLPL